MPIKPRQLEKILQDKFNFEVQMGNHRYLVLRLPNLPPIRTMISHSKKKDIHKGLESAIAKQLRVRKNFYNGMISCTNSREDYYRKVQEDPYPPF